MSERLQKFLSRAGVASRRRAEALILQGRVQVNNRVVTTLGSKVEAGRDLVTLDGKLVEPSAERSYFIFYKPPGVVTTLQDPQGRPTVADYLKELQTRVYPVGRLDYDAEGALLLIDDGELANQLMHPRFQVPRTYLAKVRGVPLPQTLDKLRAGVRLEDGMATPVSVEVFEKAEKNTWLKIVVVEGRQHLIKRMCAAIGHPVVRLFRPFQAGISVEGLRPGALRALTPAEVDRVQRIAGGQPGGSEPLLKLPARRHGHGVPGFEGSPEEEDGAPKPAARAPQRPATSSRPPKPRSAPSRPGARKSRASPRAGTPRPSSKSSRRPPRGR